MGLTQLILKNLDTLTDLSDDNHRFDLKIFNRIKEDAYLIAEKDKFEKKPEEYWKLSKEHLVVVLRDSINITIEEKELEEEYNLLGGNCKHLIEHLNKISQDKYLAIYIRRLLGI